MIYEPICPCIPLLSPFFWSIIIILYRCILPLLQPSHAMFSYYCLLSLQSFLFLLYSLHEGTCHLIYFRNRLPWLLFLHRPPRNTDLVKAFIFRFFSVTSFCATSWLRAFLSSCFWLPVLFRLFSVGSIYASHWSNLAFFYLQSTFVCLQREHTQTHTLTSCRVIMS